jgi:hypothetical protein
MRLRGVRVVFCVCVCVCCWFNLRAYLLSMWAILPLDLHPAACCLPTLPRNTKFTAAPSLLDWSTAEAAARLGCASHAVPIFRVVTSVSSGEWRDGGGSLRLGYCDLPGLWIVFVVVCQERQRAN